MAGTQIDPTVQQLHDELLADMPDGKHVASECAVCTPPAGRETASEGAGTVAEPTSTIDLKDPAVEAIVRDRVERETADLRTRAETAERERDEKQTRIDVLEAEKSTAEQAAQAAKDELDSFRTEVENERASVSRRDTRKAQLIEKVPHLNDEWFGAEVAKRDDQTSVTRLDRIAGMKDDEFTDYVSEIASAFAGVKVEPGKGTQTTGAGATPPRETAMAGTTPTGTEKSSASSRWIGSRSAFRR